MFVCLFKLFTSCNCVNLVCCCLERENVWRSPVSSPLLWFFYNWNLPYSRPPLCLRLNPWRSRGELQVVNVFRLSSSCLQGSLWTRALAGCEEVAFRHRLSLPFVGLTSESSRLAPLKLPPSFTSTPATFSHNLLTSHERPHIFLDRHFCQYPDADSGWLWCIRSTLAVFTHLLDSWERSGRVVGQPARTASGEVFGFLTWKSERTKPLDSVLIVLNKNLIVFLCLTHTEHCGSFSSCREHCDHLFLFFFLNLRLLRFLSLFKIVSFF